MEDRPKKLNIERVVEELQPLIRGWIEYFKYAQVKGTLEELDGWVRMRLRSILRKRAHHRGRGRGSDHQRWPTAFFTALGLFTMTEAHAVALQSQ